MSEGQIWTNQLIKYHIITSLVFSTKIALALSGTRFNQALHSRGRKARGQGHKKIRGEGQGQLFRGQTLSRPRTGMLEAKDTSGKCSPKSRSKIFFFNFSGDPPKKVL